MRTVNCILFCAGLCGLMSMTGCRKSQEPAPLPFAPLMHFRFNGNLKNEGNGEAKWELKNTRFRRNALYLNGKYDGFPDGYTAICQIPSLSYETFTVAVRLKSEDSRVDRNTGTYRDNLLTGGRGWRWFGLERSKAGNLVVMFNNGSYLHEVRGAALKPRVWTVIACSVNLPEHRVLVFLNGKSVAEINLPDYFELEILRSWAQKKVKEHPPTQFTFSNYGNSKVFHGLVDELIVYDRALSVEEMGNIPLRP